MRILLVISELNYGGAERQVVLLANTLNSLGHDAYVCTLSDEVPLARELTHADRLYALRRKTRWDPSLFPQLANVIRRVQPDVVHGFLLDAEILSCVCGHLMRIPVIAGSERGSQHSYSLAMRQLYRWVSRWMTVCVANSPQGRNHHQATFDLPDDRYRVVANAVDLSRFYPDRTNSAHRLLKLDPDVPVIGMVASFKSAKNHSLFFRACEDLQRQQPIQVVVIGSRSPELLAAAEATQLSRVHVLDAQLEIELFYNTMDVLVSPSLHEGMSNAIIEAAASGVPVVVSKASAYLLQGAQGGIVGDCVTSDQPKEWARAISDVLTSFPAPVNAATTFRDTLLQRFGAERLAEEMLDAYSS